MYANKNNRSVADFRNDAKFTGVDANAPMLIMSILYYVQRIIFWGTLTAVFTDLAGLTDFTMSFFVWSVIAQIILKILTLWPYSLVAKRTLV